MPQKVKIKKREWVKSGFYPILKTVFSHLKFDGTWSADLERETVQRGNIVAVLPYDAKTDQVVLIEQFRIAAFIESENRDPSNPNGVIWETVSGYVDEGETPEIAARRELLEESGLTCLKLIPMGSVLTNPGMCDERLSLFLAEIDSVDCDGLFGLAEEGEDIRVSALDRCQALDMVKNGVIEKSSAIIAIYRLNEYLEEKKGAEFCRGDYTQKC